MSQPKFTAQRDANEHGIVMALLAVGATVVPINSPGYAGVPDLLVGYRGRDGVHRNFLLEVKTEKGRLNTAQIEFHKWWCGRVYVVRTIHDALVAIGAVMPIAGMDCRA